MRHLLFVHCKVSDFFSECLLLSFGCFCFFSSLPVASFCWWMKPRWISVACTHGCGICEQEQCSTVLMCLESCICTNRYKRPLTSLWQWQNWQGSACMAFRAPVPPNQETTSNLLSGNCPWPMLPPWITMRKVPASLGQHCDRQHRQSYIV